MKPYVCRIHGQTMNYYGDAGLRRCRRCHTDRELKYDKTTRNAYLKSWNRSDRGKQSDSLRRMKDKAAAIAAYGGACSCCRESHEAFLTIDHIHDDGAEHKREIGSKLYQWLKTHGYPKDGFRLLCFNCNTGRYINGGACPHREMKPLSAQIIRMGFIGRREPFRESLTAGG